MKSLLLPVDTGDSLAATMETARVFATRFDAVIDAVVLRPAFAEIVAPDPIVAVSIPPIDWDETQFVRQARSSFDAVVAKSSGAATFRWRGGETVEDSGLGALGRLFDLTVMSRPGPKGSRMTAFEAALFDSGRPVLMAPPVAPKSIGDTILIHWNCSTETARVIALALPILQKAKRVHFVTVDGNTVPGPSAREALSHLAAHGIEATERIVKQGRGPGEAILEEARAIGADLLLKGAYTQSRLRQMIFGGATSHILAKAELPVFFAH